MNDARRRKIATMYERHDRWRRDDGERDRGDGKVQGYRGNGARTTDGDLHRAARSQVSEYRLMSR